MRMRHVSGSLGGAIALVLATPVSLESTRWWHSSRIVAELGLSARQAAAVDGIYRSMSAHAAVCARDVATARRTLDDALLADSVDDVFEIATSRPRIPNPRAVGRGRSCSTACFGSCRSNNSTRSPRLQHELALTNGPTSPEPRSRASLQQCRRLALP
jgi:hypothetical protein